MNTTKRIIQHIVAISVIALSFAVMGDARAAPKPNPESGQSTAPTMVTTTLTATISPHVNTSYGNYGSGSGPWGGCGYGTQDFGPPWGNMDWNNDTYFLQGEMQNAAPFVDGALASWTPIYHWCYGRGDSFSFNLSSIPSGAIVQAHSASLEFINMMAGSNQQNWFYLNHSSGSTVLGINSNAQFVPNSLILGGSGSVSNPTGYYQTPNQVVIGPNNPPPIDIIPASLVQQWVTNRTSGSLSVWNGFNGGYQFAARTIRLNFTYIVDTTPPTTTHALSGTLGSNGWYVSNVTATLTATDDAGGAGVVSTTMDGSTYTAARTISTQGASTHTYFSTDAANNVETAKSFTVNIDTAAPTSAVTSHVSNQPVRGMISFGGTASDATSGVALVEVSSDNGATWNATAGTTSWTYSLNTTGIADGTTITLIVRATDSAGNAQASSGAGSTILSLVVDNTPPVLSHIITGTIGSNNWYNAIPITVTVVATDTVSGIAGIVLNGAAYTAPVIVSTQGAATWGYSATDNAGNAAASSLSFQIDSIAPSSTIALLSGSAQRGTITLSGTASDATSGVALVEYSTNNGTTWITVVGTTSWTASVDTATLGGDGSKTVLVRATDVAGNVQASSGAGSTSLTFTVDNTAPTSSFSAGSSFCPTCGDTLNLTYSNSDAGSGIASWSLTAGSTTIASGTTAVNTTTAWNGSGLAAGSYTLTFTSTDGAGNQTVRTAAVTLLDPVRSVTPSGIIFPVTVLSGSSTTQIGSTPAWVVVNTFACGVGFHINVKSGNFTDGAGHTIPIGNFRMRLQQAAISPQSGATTAPTSLLTNYTPLSTSDQALMSASACNGRGTYSVVPEFDFLVPADAYAGNYTAPFTVTIVAGP